MSSIGFTCLWFRLFVSRKKIKSLLVDEQTAAIGRVVFSVPVLGDESSMYLSDEPIATGNRVRVIAVLSPDQKDRVFKVEKIR